MRKQNFFQYCLDPFISLNAKEVQESVQNMRSTLARLSKAFLDVQGARRIVEIVLTKVEKFCSAIPILETICNPGLQERHWKKVWFIVPIITDSTV